MSLIAKLEDKVMDKIEDKIEDKLEHSLGGKIVSKIGDKVEDKYGDKIELVAKKLLGDKLFAGSFKKDPMDAIKKLLGKDVDEDESNAIVSGVKKKLSLEGLGDLLDSDGDGKPDLGAVSKLGGILKK